MREKLIPHLREVLRQPVSVVGQTLSELLTPAVGNRVASGTQNKHLSGEVRRAASRLLKRAT